jgi:hypothetical protein
LRVRANAARLDVAVTGWIALDSSAKPILPPLHPDTTRLPTSVRRMAIVTSWHGDRSHRHPCDRSPATMRDWLRLPARSLRMRQRSDTADSLD